MEFAININQKLYHGSDKNLILQNDFFWCALDSTVAQKYAKNVYTITPTQSLRLLDITNENFHKDFMNRINTLFSFNKQLKEINKWKYLAPLGLPSLKIQMQHLSRTATGVYPSTPGVDKTMIDTIEYFGEFIGNKHRYSVVTKENGNLDTEMVKMIKHLYGSTNVDGIISPSLWPSYHQGGFQHPEICIFEPVGKTSIEFGVKKGGGKKIANDKTNYDFSCSTFNQMLRDRGIDPDKALKSNPLIYA
jgi:hypothetical protein